MATKKFHFLLLILLLSGSCLLATTEKLGKIGNYLKNNYGTVAICSVFAIFLMHTIYNKTQENSSYNEWENWIGPIDHAFPLNILKNTLETRIYCISIPAIGGGMLAINYFSGGKFDFLNNSTKTITELTKVFGSCTAPVLTAMVLENFY